MTPGEIDAFQKRLADAEHAIARAEEMSKKSQESAQKVREAAARLQEEKDLALATLIEKADSTNQKTLISKLKPGVSFNRVIKQFDFYELSAPTDTEKNPKQV